MSRREYKTVAMPQLLKGRRRRRQSRAEMVAEMVSGVINAQARQGWSYVRADSFRSPERRSWFHRSEEVVYTVLVFEREVASAQPATEPAVLPATAPPAPPALPAPVEPDAAPTPTAVMEIAKTPPAEHPVDAALNARPLEGRTTDLTGPLVRRRSDEAEASPLSVKMRETLNVLVDRARRPTH